MNRSVSILIAVSLCGCVSPQRVDRASVDRSTPEATVISFTKAAARGDSEAALACCLPGGLDCQDVEEFLANPRNDLNRVLRAVDVDAPMPIVSREEVAGGVVIVWRMTLGSDVRISDGGGHVFEKRSTIGLDATLKKSGSQWLIDGL